MRTQLQLAAVWRVMALMLSAAPAVAQPPDSPVSITAFGGVAMAFGPHPATGVAIALKPHPGPVSLEFEYLRSRPDPFASGSGIASLAGNILVQPSWQRSRFQYYGTLGVGFYSLVRDYQGSTDSARNIGGGAKVTLAGPWKLRMDYRAFLLARTGGAQLAHRFYVGVVAGF
jgi:hypothetical protein